MDSTGDPSAQYFETDPSVESNPRSIELVLPDVYLSLTTDTGVFSGNKVDQGTRILLREHPSIPEGTRSVLDLGCGYGPIALTAAKRCPSAEIWGIDVNRRAIALATHNAQANNIDNVRFGHASELPTELRFDLILTNPPIRVGKPALHELLTTWLDRLTPSGRAWMVVQKHLGSDSLATWLTEQGWNTTRMASQKGYRILEVTARRTERP